MAVITIKMTSLRESIETYIHAKDGNRPHLMSRAFDADAELLMDVKTDAISFPATVDGLNGIADVLVSQFAQRYENVYTFCMGAPPDHASTFRCEWLVCMTEKQSGAARVGWGTYEWFSREATGRIAKLNITIEQMNSLPAAHADSILEWASALPYPWCPHVLPLRNAPAIQAVRQVASCLARRQPACSDDPMGPQAAT